MKENLDVMTKKVYKLKTKENKEIVVAELDSREEERSNEQEK